MIIRRQVLIIRRATIVKLQKKGQSGKMVMPKECQ